VVYIADEAQANGHGRREYHDFRFLFSQTGCVEPPPMATAPGRC
jgi:hypothetical protein